MRAVGHVLEIRRYPVKSLRGERLDQAVLTTDGVAGDRRLALRDAAAGTVLSAKHVAALLTASARTAGERVLVTLPDGAELDATSEDARAALAALVGRRVEVVSAPGGAARPTIEYDDEVTFQGRAGGFFDSSALHVLTTAALRRLDALLPGGRIDARRFRPNVIVDVAGDGFIEEEWVGRRVSLGDAVIEVVKPCSRCVMTTHEQEDLPADRDVLRTINERNAGNAGVLAAVVREGRIAVGDAVFVE